MARRTFLWGVAALLTLTAGSVWAGWTLANSHTSTRAVDCCLDPTCLPGCCEACPPDCNGTAPTKTATKDSCCCDDPTCPSGCSPERPPNCLDLTAKAKEKKDCPPCPFCP